MAAYNSESIQRCLFVGDLHPDVCEQLLYNTFTPYGFITSVKVIRDIATGCSRGFGHVIFAHAADAERAMYNLMFAPLCEKPIRVMWYHPDPTLRHSGIGNLYITGLARDIDSYTLYDIFSNFGEILSCKVASDHLGSKGYGFVHFKTMEAAENAIKILNGMQINNEKVSITYYKTYTKRQAECQANKAEPKSFPPSLYVSNLPYYFTNEQLGKLFSTFGTVLSANVIMRNGRSKGFGFVALDNFEATTNALDVMNGRWVGKRILSVALSNSAEKRRERAEQECKNDSQQQVHQPAYALPPGNFGIMHSSSPVNLQLWIQPSTLQDAKSLLQPGQKFKEVISTTRLELCKTEILKTPVKSISCPALRLENSVNKKIPYVVGLPHHGVNATLHMTQPALRPKTATTLPPKIYSRVLKNMADHYNENFPTEKDAKQSSVWETMKSCMASVVRSSLTWSLIGLYVVHKARR